MDTPVGTSPAPQMVRTQGQRPEGNATRIRLDHLDGIRGLAALFVMAHHIWRSYTTVALPGAVGLATNWLLYGHLAVDVFIVLSGFCLMLPVARSGALRGGWRTFYKSRSRRILPPLYAAILLAIVLVFHHDRHVSLSAILSNVFLVSDIWQNNLDGPLWSVALEWKIYFLFPVFVWLWLRSGSRAVLGVAAALSAMLYCVVLACTFIAAKSHVCPWYVFLFAMGMVATPLAVRPNDSLPSRLLPILLLGTFAGLAAALLVWPVTAQGEDVLFNPHLPVIDVLAGAVTAMLLLILGRKALRGERSTLNACLAWWPFVFVGTIGYSLYLIHALLIYAVKNAIVAHFHSLPTLLVILADMGIVVAIAYLFHLVFERPFMTRPAPKTERQAEVAAIASPAP